ncbi:hypothetical protein HBI79_078060 [Parastagonospora nodorum]|nr:hypothetical protein HBI79_078060 [Parastagonospora nodorum]
MHASFPIVGAVALLARSTSAQLYPGQSNLNHTCQLQQPLLSCPSSDPSKVDSCCVETFGGLVLSTQFWNTNSGGSGQLLPKDTFTLHGLWPDFCNGSYTQYCDLNRQYDPIPSPNTTNGLPNGTFVAPYNGSNIGTFLEPFGRYDLLDYMNNYWIAFQQDNPGFWGHEFSKHATCFSTFNVPCYGPMYRQHEEVVDFFETTIKYYKRFPTFKWLEEASITPSNATGYSYTAIRDVLFAKHGGVPFIGCNGPRYSESDVSPWNNTTAAGKGRPEKRNTGPRQNLEVYGRPQEGNVIPTSAAPTYLTNCAKAPGAVMYYQRSNGSERVPTVPF